MPPSTRIKKEDILTTAYEIVREKGIENLNARAIAKKLNCSIQPIFYQFENMEELKKEVFQKIENVYESYLTEASKQERAYKAMGMAYIQFARQEPKLFQILFMTDYQFDIDHYINRDKSFQNVARYAAATTGLPEEKMRTFHFKIWIFTHGLATMIVNRSCNFTDEQVSQLLKDVYIAFYEQELKQENGKGD